ncbi:MAG: CHAT domain-containing protein [Pyrinomonadaceae bacterium]
MHTAALVRTSCRLLTAALLLAAFCDAARAKGEPERLTPGRKVERSIARGEEQLFAVGLDSGQFARVVVEQRGVDLIVSVHGPGGESFEVDSQNGTHGPEFVSLIAPAPGDYVFKVKKNQKEAEDGTYSLTLMESRPAAASDGERVAAERALLRGQELCEKNDRGSLNEALAKFGPALRFFAEQGEPYQEAFALHLIGVTHYQLGEKDKALESFGPALARFAALGDRAGEAMTLDEMGEIYFSQGKYDRAREAAEKSLEHSVAVNNHVGSVGALINMGRISVVMGDEKAALRYTREALKLCDKIRYPVTKAMATMHLADLKLNAGEPESALYYFNTALSLYRKARDNGGVIAALKSICWVSYRLDMRDEALLQCDRALKMSRDAGDRAGEYHTLNTIGWVHILQGKRRTALEKFARALAVSREVEDRWFEASILSSMMSVWKALGKPRVAIFYGKQAVNIYQEMRANSQGFDEDSQKGFVKSKESIYRMLAELLVADRRLLEAQEVLDMLKEEEYFEFIRRQSAGATPGGTRVSLTEAESNLEQMERAAGQRATVTCKAASELQTKKGVKDKGHVAELREQCDASIAEHNRVVGKLLDELKGEAASDASAREEIRDASALMTTLGGLPFRPVALYTIVGEDKYTVLLYTPTAAVARGYKIKGDDLYAKVMAFRQALQNPEADPLPLARELYTILVEPVAPDLEVEQAKVLMWNFDGFLRYVPVAALHDGKGYLVERYLNVMFTRATLSRLLGEPKPSEWQALGLGVTRNHPAHPALPAVKDELYGIIRPDGEFNKEAGVIRGTILLDDDFTEKAMRDALGEQYQVVHIASHFEFRPRNEQKSYLLLGDGAHLPLTSIMNSRSFFEGVELLTLSACNTALGEVKSDGREFENFGLLAQQSGAGAVVATLWRGADPSTSLLMRKFYKVRDEEGLSKVVALQRAQLSFLKGSDGAPAEVSADESRGASRAGRMKKGSESGVFVKDPAAPYAHPYYWAPFIMIGNWR